MTGMEYLLLNVYHNYIDAHIVLGMLIDNNINCHLLNEHTISIDPILSSANGGIQLMVAAPHAERALNLLQNFNGENA